jgi:hypothetical protein
MIIKFSATLLYWGEENYAVGNESKIGELREWKFGGRKGEKIGSYLEKSDFIIMNIISKWMQEEDGLESIGLCLWVWTCLIILSL